jgi:NAD(P)-dependent dehydrogenase (short-subunit alcohol dehydrogenase family)
MSDKPFAGKVAIVTGSGRGIGRGEALELARLGAKVVVNDLPRGNPTSAEQVAAEIRAAGGEAVAAPANIASMEGAKSIVDTALEAFGRLDILINTAGTGRVGAVGELPEADWDTVIAVNLKGTFATVHFAAPVFIRQKTGGVIVNFSSEAGLGDYYLTPYSASKEGVVGFTRAIARELAPYKVRCVAVRPRAYDTGMASPTTFPMLAEFDRRFGRPMIGTHRQGFGIMGTAAELGAIVAWLCTDEAAVLNGRVVQAGGGEVGIWSEPKVESAVHSGTGWTFEELRRVGGHLLGGNRDEQATLPPEAWEQIDKRLTYNRARMAAAQKKV